MTCTRTARRARNNTGEPTVAAGRPQRQLSITKRLKMLHSITLAIHRRALAVQWWIVGLAFSYNSKPGLVLLHVKVTFYHFSPSFLYSKAPWQIKCVIGEMLVSGLELLAFALELLPTNFLLSNLLYAAFSNTW